MKHAVMMLTAIAICIAPAAQAQTTPTQDTPAQQSTPPAQTPAASQKPAPGMIPDGREYVEFVGGPAFGHKFGGSYGGEFGYWFSDTWGLFGEVGRIQNAGGSDISRRADIISAAIGGSAKPHTNVTYYDGGLTYRFPATGRYRPYASLGLGAATVSNKTKFFVGGADVTGQLNDVYGVLLGNDLSGSYTSAFFSLGIGVRMPFGSRWVADASYRYGRVGGNNKDQADIPGLNTNRLQFGFGARFGANGRP